MKNYSTVYNKKDLIKNNAGGFVSQTTDWEYLNRFLTIGSENGSYYADEKKLTVDNATNVINLIKINPLKVFNEVFETLVNNKAPKVDPSIFVLALLRLHGSNEVKGLISSNSDRLFKTFTQLTQYVTMSKELGGTGRSLRTTINNWYTKRSVESLDYQMAKYPNRNGFSHKDLIRIGHTDLSNFNDSVIRTVMKGEPSYKDDLPRMYAKELVLSNKDNVSKVISVIKEYNLTWEMIPTELLNDQKVLSVLLQNDRSMPPTALLRNLNRLTDAKTIDLAYEKLTNVQYMKDIHPINILIALKTYSSGTGVRGSKTWNVSSRIVEGLDIALEQSVQQLEPTNKRILIAVDCSGSMNAMTSVGLTAYEVAVSLAATIGKVEKYSDVIMFDTAYKGTMNKRDSFKTLLQNAPRGGGTDCSVPYRLMLTNKLLYDIVIVLTDNESWAHKSDVVDTVKKLNGKMKNVIVASTATKATILPTRKDTLNISGFDASVPELIKNFISESK
jgi:60 kDa SS-A/Ro ribonucleoprotein